MEEFKEIDEVLASRGLIASGPVISNPAVPGGIYVSLQIQRDSAGRQLPSYQALAELKAELEGKGFRPEFSLMDENARLVEEALRASLITSHPNLVRNSFISMAGDTAHVWVDTKKEVSPSEKEALSEHIAQFARMYGIRRSVLHVSNEANLATNTEILSIVRNLAPASCEGVRDALRARDFDVPSLGWINHRFDAMRKANLLVRRPDRTYVLTAEALHRLGTAKGRFSPDVSRLLALARRGG